MPTFTCDDCGHTCEDDYTAGDDWPDGILRGVPPCCPDCEEKEGVRVHMRAVDDEP